MKFDLKGHWKTQKVNYFFMMLSTKILAVKAIRSIWIWNTLMIKFLKYYLLSFLWTISCLELSLLLFLPLVELFTDPSSLCLEGLLTKPSNSPPLDGLLTNPSISPPLEDFLTNPSNSLPLDDPREINISSVLLEDPLAELLEKVSSSEPRKLVLLPLSRSLEDPLFNPPSPLSLLKPLFNPSMSLLGEPLLYSSPSFLELLLLPPSHGSLPLRDESIVAGQNGPTNWQS